MYTGNCYLCKSTKYTSLWKISRYSIQKCNECGFIFVLPIPQKSELNRFYSSFDYKDALIKEYIIRNDAKRSIGLIKRFLKKQNISHLDIGCGRGFFMDEARDSKWDSFGIDYSNKTLKYAKDVLHLSVTKADINSYSSDRRYDIITLNQFIEHTDSPNNIISKCYQLLKKGGLIYMATPNIESISAKVLGQNFDHLIPPEHLGYYSKDTMKDLLVNNGFQILRMGSWSYKEDLAGIIKSLIKRRNVKTSLRKVEIGAIEENSIKRIKHILFDEIFCKIFYRILSVNAFGTILETLAIKN